MSNVDADTVADFGAEWTAFDQSALSSEELTRQFQAYFQVFPWDELAPDAAGFDAGCGSGRWARCVAPRVGHLHCVDASQEAVSVAQRNLAGFGNCTFHVASLAELPFADSSMDFGYSLGVLHHLPDTEAGLRACVAKLRPGAPLLVYVYYALDGRARWFRALWRATDVLRRALATRRFRTKVAATGLIAALVYYPLARFARAAERLGLPVEGLPLSIYRDRSFYSMRTDALDRFGTRLEKRFTRTQLGDMMRRAGLTEVEFSEEPPYWCAVGRRASRPS